MQKLVRRTPGNSQEVEEDTSFQGDILLARIAADLALHVAEADGRRTPLGLPEDTLLVSRCVGKGMSADRRRIQAGKAHQVADARMAVLPVEHTHWRFFVVLHRTPIHHSEVGVQDHADNRIQVSARRAAGIERNQVDHAVVAGSSMLEVHHEVGPHDDLTCHRS